MELHVLPQHGVSAIMDASDCEVLELREDGYTAYSAGRSNTFFGSKAIS